MGFFDGAGVSRSVVCASVGIVDDFSEGGEVGAFDGFGCLGLLISRSFLVGLSVGLRLGAFGRLVLGLLISRSFLVGLSVGLRLGAFGCLVLLREDDAFVILFLTLLLLLLLGVRFAAFTLFLLLLVLLPSLLLLSLSMMLSFLFLLRAF